MKFKLLVNWKLKASLLTLLCIFSFSVIQAQTITVKGTVTGEGVPLPGVSVLVRGTNKGAVTDFDGKYEIKAKANDVLVFSYIGFSNQAANVGGKTTINVTLKSDVAALDEVVVIGYGTQKKKEITGAVTQLKSDELMKNATSDLGSALQGQMAGVNVTASSGAPGSESNILIRGISSINGQNSPLYIVDGIPYDGDPKLSINEIETIDVLKDAASAAIYGTRGAGGVILITTKKGKMGQMSIKVDSYYGIQSITSGTPLLSVEQDLYTQFLSKAALNGTTYGNSWTAIENGVEQLSNNTDLLSVLQVDNAPIQNHSLSVSGGKDGLAYNISANYFSQEGMLINSGYDRFNIRANTQYNKGKWKVATGLGFRVEEQQYEPWGLLLEAYKYHPWQREIDLTSTTVDNAGPNGSNEAANLGGNKAKFLQTDVRNGDSFDANINATYQFNKNLSYSSRFGTSYSNNTRVRINPLILIYDNDGKIIPQQQRSGVYNYSDRSTKFSWENIVNYNKSFGEHNIKLLGVYSAEKYNFTSFYARKYDLASNDVTVLNGALLDADVGSGTGWSQDKTNTLIGMLGRVQYNYKGKYLLSVSARRDGSSRFSETYRWETFPSYSIGWNVSDEKFYEPVKDVVNTFKLRASRGTTGNQGIRDYSYGASIVLNNDYVFGPEESDALVLGAIQTAFANKNVKWETSVSNNIGVDIGLLKDKLNFTADFYETTKKDLLFPLLLPPTTGAGANATVILNVGDMKNRGSEYALNYRNSGKDLSWNAGLTYYLNENTITKMSGSNKIAYLDGSKVADTNNEDLVSVIAEGYEAGSFFLIQTDGIISTQEALDEYKILVPTAKLGDLKYVDQITEDTNGDGIPDAKNGTIDNNDRRYSGSGTPDFEMGFNFSANYKNFDFSMQWYGSFGAEILNGSKAYAYKHSTHRDLAYQWSPANTTSEIPTFRGRDHENYRGYTDYWKEDGSFIRLKNVSLGYTLPKSFTNKMSISKFRVYVAAQNPLTITKYTGFDPEVGNNGLSTKGIDKGTYPISSQFRAGLQFEF